MNRLMGKVALVTGASKGIGAATALRFAKEGAFVFAASRSVDKTKVWMADEQITENIFPVEMDVRDTQDIKSVIMTIKKQFGRLDILVNNAAVEYNERIGMISRDNMHEMFETNVFGVIELIQYSARLMQRKGGGSIVNISSLTGERGSAGQLVYSATKGAVISITKSAARELAPYNIRVNSVAPGLTDTDMYRNVDEEKLAQRVSNICMGRLAKPSEIASGILFLASDEASFVSGHVLNIDGCTI